MSDGPELQITLQPEWGTGPIWIGKGDGIAEPYDADEVTDLLALSGELRGAIAVWDERFQNTLDAEYPPDSAFPTPEDEAAWLAHGKVLALRLRAEVPEAAVTYETIDGELVPLDDCDDNENQPQGASAEAAAGVPWGQGSATPRSGT